ncbi:carbonic anhydrase [Terrisporobacter sp.]|uniref:carbonic anhydrase n=1 Tax=Terrisporobacter sp. TaxID=1965305 RepID=UPI002A80403D|nr:carbonic anhydrase [Terrisporobacter sp.]MDY4737811.1 carbonic anhydrase [Terrisporobacter sp.]
MTNPDEALKRLKEGQHPYAVVVSCSDSRVTPTTVFNAGLGEIFDIRIAGNVVDDDALGSIEYGVEHTGAPLVVVMGHESCGAVTAAYDEAHNNAHAEGNIEDLVEKILPSVKNAKDIDEGIHNNIDNVAKEINNDAIVKHLVDQGKVKVVRAYYSLDGKVTFME